MIRRSLLAGAVALLVVPALAGCEAGLNAPTLEFHPASSGAHKVIDGLTISNVFVLAAPSGASSEGAITIATRMLHRSFRAPGTDFPRSSSHAVGPSLH